MEQRKALIFHSKYALMKRVMSLIIALQNRYMNLLVVYTDSISEYWQPLSIYVVHLTVQPKRSSSSTHLTR